MKHWQLNEPKGENDTFRLVLYKRKVEVNSYHKHKLSCQDGSSNKASVW